MIIVRCFACVWIALYAGEEDDSVQQGDVGLLQEGATHAHALALASPSSSAAPALAARLEHALTSRWIWPLTLVADAM